jgi:hypothetical protein
VPTAAILAGILALLAAIWFGIVKRRRKDAVAEVAGAAQEATSEPVEAEVLPDPAPPAPETSNPPDPEGSRPIKPAFSVPESRIDNPPAPESAAPPPPRSEVAKGKIVRYDALGLPLRD